MGVLPASVTNGNPIQAMPRRRHAAVWKWIKRQIDTVVQWQEVGKIQKSRKFDPVHINTTPHDSLPKGSGQFFVLPT